MATVRAITDFLTAFAPPRLAEEWDNVGLLVGDPDRDVRRVMTCLTVTPDSAAEAIDERAALIVSHHPMPFRALKRITTESTVGRLLWTLIGAGIAIHSPHTAFDSAATGINQRLAVGLGLSEISSLRSAPGDPPGPGLGSLELGAGRCGSLGAPGHLGDVARIVKRFLGLTSVSLVGDVHMPVARIAVACGSAGEFLDTARRADCQVLVTGETNFHTCLEAEASGIGLILTGHYASERFAVEHLATDLASSFPDLHTWPSRREHDPMQTA